MTDIAITDWTKLGATIRAERSRAGLSQHALAAKAGISRSWLAKVEAGHRGAELEQILRLLEALGLSLILRNGAGATSGSNLIDPTDPYREAMNAWMDHQLDFADKRRMAWESAGESVERSTGKSS